MNPAPCRWIHLGLTLAVLGLIAWQDGWHVSPVDSPKFLVSPVTAVATNSAPEFHEQFIDPTFVQPSTHVSSICELPEGRLAAVWYAGTREGARDVAIYFATREPGLTNAWSPPRAIVTRETAGHETYRYVKKVGNAVIFAGAGRQLHLIFVTTGFGGWSCSSLNLKTSRDGGKTWTISRRLGLSPFLNVSELVKNKPAPLTDGGFAVPVYHEFLGAFPELLWWRPATGEFSAVKTRAFGGHSAFQPALVTLDETNAVLLCRTTGSVKKLQVSRTADSGKTWSGAQTIDLPNSNSGLDAIRLADGRLLLAFNDTVSGRDNLRLAVSADSGATWQRAATLAEEAGAEFSYPTLLQSNGGFIHVTYTWKRRGITHATFNAAWLDQQLKGHRR
ncbi:MAG: hypothetical protein EPO07_16940 [Verrucomicrobia bacterium]|nr:MAG: hypothetical protein EPO07_16940 [Verrucomicrobiota bacterium]